MRSFISIVFQICFKVRR